MSIPDPVIAAYSADARALAEQYESLAPSAVHASALSIMPPSGDGRLALDVGAGTGRDAAWLAGLGYEVVAVEPAEEMRRVAAEIHADVPVRWIDDALPSLDRLHALALSFDLVMVSAVWQHVAPADRPRALRKLATAMKPGSLLVLTLRSGPAPSDRPMHPTSVGEVEGLARSLGLEVVRVAESGDERRRPDVRWTTMCLRMPDDGTGALPLVRGIALSDGKSSTYKLALLRAVARAAEYSPAAATPAPDGRDAVELPLGLVALNWLRLYLPLVRAGIPQAPGNVGTERLGFAKEGFRSLLESGVAATELRIGASFAGATADALASAIGRTVTTIAEMPANFTRYANSDERVFKATRGRGRGSGATLDIDGLRTFGLLEVPGHLWRAMSRFGAWIDPMLIAEWARISRGYADRLGLAIAPGAAEAALVWVEPVRSTAIGRLAASRLLAEGREIRCVWTERRLSASTIDLDHCLPWSAWPCGDLWNLMPSASRVNRHEKRGKLPSAAALARARPLIERWWSEAYLDDGALRDRFVREATAALPLAADASPAACYAALDWRRLRLRQDQQVPEWAPI